MYISRGKVNIGDWGEPLKAAMVEGEEGKTFGWNNGQDWIVLNIGVQPDHVDQLDDVTSNTIGGFIASFENDLDQFGSFTDVTSRDSLTNMNINVYTDDQLARVTGVPNGGDVLNVLAKLSNADRDAFWLTVQEGEVLQADVAGVINELTEIANNAKVVKRSIPNGGDGGNILSNIWVQSVDPVSTPIITYPVKGDVVSPYVRLICKPFSSTYTEAVRTYREFNVNGTRFIVKTDHIDLNLVPGMQYTVKCRDVSVIGASGWSEVTFETRNVYNSISVLVNAIDGAIKDPIVLNCEMLTVGGVDDHIATDWVLRKNDVVVWESSYDTVNVTSVTVPAGIVTVGEYQIEVRAHGKVHGSSQWSYVTARVDAPFNGLAVGYTHTPYLTFYNQDVNAFTKGGDPDSIPTNVVRECAFSPDGALFIITHSYHPFTTLYSRRGDVFTKIASPPANTLGSGYGCAFSPDGAILAVTHSYNTPRLMLYSRNGNTFTLLPSPATQPTGTGQGCAFSQDGKFLAVTHYTTPFVTIYSRNGTTFTKLPNPSVLPTGNGRGCAFSPNGQFLAVVHATSPFITIYSINGNTFTKLANPSVLPINAGEECCFSPDSSLLVVGSLGNNSRRLIIYSREGNTFTALPDPDVIPTANVYGCAFSPDGNYLAVNHALAPYIMIYARSGTNFTKLPDPDILPAYNGTAGLAWYYETLPVSGLRAT